MGVYAHLNSSSLADLVIDFIRAIETAGAGEVEHLPASQ